MSNNKIKDKLKRESKKDQRWIKKAQYRRDNKHWLDISFTIAVRVLSILKKNKKTKKYPYKQKQLAEIIQCSPQYISKIIKGKENLTLETISKLETALEVKLIESSKSLSMEDLSVYISESEVPRKSELVFCQDIYSTSKMNISLDSFIKFFDEFNYSNNEYSKSEIQDIKLGTAA